MSEVFPKIFNKVFHKIFSYDCAVNDAKDERFISDAYEGPRESVVETVQIEESDQIGLQTRKVWLILCIISIVGVSYSWGIAAQANAWLAPAILIIVIILLAWLRKPCQRPILLKIAPCFGIRISST